MDLRKKLLDSWMDTWAELELRTPATLGVELLDRWSEPSRHYHDLEHLDACLTEARAHGDLLEDAPAVALALWFHDAIYDPKAQDNEERSAELARERLGKTDLAPERIERICRHIQATHTHEAKDDPDTRLLLDVDLSILAASPERFARYEQEIRSEYDWVEEARYTEARRGILRGFLDRARIFETPQFHDRLEGRARENLTRVLEGT